MGENVLVFIDAGFLRNRNVYKFKEYNSNTSSNTRSIFPGDLRVARCFSFYWRFFKWKIV